jgi:hypothetical protein
MIIVRRSLLSFQEIDVAQSVRLRALKVRFLKTRKLASLRHITEEKNHE